MRKFSQVDVFTDELTLGNPLAVVHDADGLSDDQLSAVARWTNLSETTFLLSPTNPAADYRLRIFTVDGELPFAGHPTLGSAYAWLATGGAPHAADRIVQECGAGLVPVRVEGDRLAFAAPPVLHGGTVHPDDRDELVRWLGIDRADVLDAQWVDNGPGWVALLLRDAETVLSATPHGECRLTDVGLIGRHPAGSACEVEVRALFRTGGGFSEDLVTGSLNASLAQWLIGSGHLPRRYVAAQGTLLGRRGRIYVTADGSDVWVGGHVTAGVSGMIAL